MAFLFYKLNILACFILLLQLVKNQIKQELNTPHAALTIPSLGYPDISER